MNDFDNEYMKGLHKQLDLKIKLLNQLRSEEAITASPSLKFEVQERISKITKEIEEVRVQITTYKPINIKKHKQSIIEPVSSKVKIDTSKLTYDNFILLSKIVGVLVIIGGIYYYFFISYDNTIRFYEGMALVERGDKYGYVNEDKEEVIPLQYYNAMNFEGGIAAVQKSAGGKWGFIDKEGKTVIPFEFMELTGFVKGLCAVKKSGEWYFIDRNGSTINSEKYDAIKYFSNDTNLLIWKVKKLGKWGITNKKGDLIVNIKYDEIGFPREGRVEVKKNEKIGFIDYMGKEVILPQYDDSFSFEEGEVLVKKNDKYFYIDKNGNFLRDF